MSGLLADFQKKERCVDDTVFWDAPEDLEAHWWRNIEFLETTSREGIVLNSSKFQFCKKDVDFAGFRITQDTKPMAIPPQAASGYVEF